MLKSLWLCSLPKASFLSIPLNAGPFLHSFLTSLSFFFLFYYISFLYSLTCSRSTFLSQLLFFRSQLFKRPCFMRLFFLSFFHLILLVIFLFLFDLIYSTLLNICFDQYNSSIHSTPRFSFLFWILVSICHIFRYLHTHTDIYTWWTRNGSFFIAFLKLSLNVFIEYICIALKGIQEFYMSASACGFFVIYRYMYEYVYTINIKSNYVIKPIPKSN